jgi:hypothetical protein
MILFQLFATSAIETGGKFAADIVDTGGILLPISTTQMVPVAKFAAAVVIDNEANLPLVSLIPVVHLHLRISPRIFRKI